MTYRNCITLAHLPILHDKTKVFIPHTVVGSRELRRLYPPLPISCGRSHLQSYYNSSRTSNHNKMIFELPVQTYLNVGNIYKQLANCILKLTHIGIQFCVHKFILDDTFQTTTHGLGYQKKNDWFIWSRFYYQGIFLRTPDVKNFWKVLNNFWSSFLLLCVCQYEGFDIASQEAMAPPTTNCVL